MNEDKLMLAHTINGIYLIDSPSIKAGFTGVISKFKTKDDSDVAVILDSIREVFIPNHSIITISEIDDGDVILSREDCGNTIDDMINVARAKMEKRFTKLKEAWEFKIS